MHSIEERCNILTQLSTINFDENLGVCIDTTFDCDYEMMAIKTDSNIEQYNMSKQTIDD